MPGSRLSAAVVFLALAVHAQEISTLKVETHLIEMTVSIHDTAGGYVPDITKDDLTVSEDGVPQTIRFFAPAERLPLSIGLLIDASGSQDRFLRDHERDVAAFLREVLTPEDRSFAVCFGNHLRLVSDWTNDGTAIATNLRRFDEGERNFPELGPKEERDLGTALNDAVFYAATERMAGNHERRRVLVVFSDGEENSSEHDLIDAIEASQDADVVVYAIRYTEVGKHGMSARDRYGARELDHLTEQTGGRAYDAHAMQVSEAFRQIAGDLRSLYSVGYYSTNTVRDGRFRKVVIGSRRGGLVLRSRTGYYAR